MRSRDSFDAKCSLLAVLSDAAAIFGGFLLAVWIRFDSGWIEVTRGHPPRGMYFYAAIVVTILLLLIFRSLGLYERPQYGHFIDKIPRLVRACSLGMLLAMALAFVIQIDPPFSRIATAIAFVTVTFFVVLERNVLFACERHWAKYQAAKRRVILLGAGPLAVRLRAKLEGEPRRRCRIAACIPLPGETPDPALPPDVLRADLSGLHDLLEREPADAVVLTQPAKLTQEALVEIMLHCERNLAEFMMVPDLFRLLTTEVRVQNVDDIPLLGVGKWPLDYFINRLVKRLEDILGSIVGLLISAPIIAVAAIAIRRDSPGPVFYKQVRCGEKGRAFNLYKLRTMRVDAEADSGPVWTSPDDPRRTRIGAFLRAYNIDELPQFWNVLKGEMSLVGPRPERPHFVEQFKDDISRYMWRHIHKPGMTGWAQINGYRGQTDLKKRIELDLWYLENWSLALDFKILLRTLAARKNAY